MSSSEEDVVDMQEEYDEESDTQVDSDDEDSEAETDNPVTYDLGTLAAFDTTALEAGQLKGNTDKYLLQISEAATEKLIKEIFDLPTQAKPGIRGWIASLPAPTTSLPREKPLPKKKAQTKWEKFAATKGIMKRKKSAKVWDEASQTYKRRHGYDRANDESKEWVLEHKGSTEADENGVVMDPWAKLRKEKKERVAKNKKQQDRNLQRATGQRLPGTIDLTSAVKAAPGKRAQKKKTDSHHVDLALKVTQRSTASMGVHDRLRDTEPAIKKFKAEKNDTELSRSVISERKQSLAVLDKLLGAPTEAEQTRFDSFSKGKGGKRKGSKKGGKKGGKKVAGKRKR